MRPLTVFFVILMFIIIPTFVYLNSTIQTREHYTLTTDDSKSYNNNNITDFSSNVINGSVVMPILGNATIKY